MALPVPLAYTVFTLYFVVIGLAFWHVFRSILSGQKASALVSGRPFLFLRTALGALLCTWYFMFKYMHWSFVTYARRHTAASVGDWLANTALFEEAWTIVSSGPARWWWSSFICTWTVVFTAVVWRESARRNLPHPWAYMLLGQLVAMSVSTSLFFCACALHPRLRSAPSRSPMWLSASLVVALWTVARTPSVVGSTRFVPNLLTMHGALLLPLLVSPSVATTTRSSISRASQLPFPALYALLVGLGSAIHLENHTALVKAFSASKTHWTRLYTAVFSHPAQSSISLDVIWVALTLLALFFTSGGFISIVLKALFGFTGAAVLAIRVAGVPLSIVLSLVPLIIVGGIGFALLALGRVRTENEYKRKKLLDSLGLTEGPIPGTDNEPPRMGGKKTIVGFWHPYCNAGGGGERVLWSAIAYLQREKPDVVCMVYTGDYPEASKEEIIGKVEERFSIRLFPGSLHFVPLPSRHLISDTFWSHLTLLGQSLGSVYLAFQGLTGKDGLWGDVYIDSMGYAFTLPIVRIIAGPATAIGTYTHYPTVSADMVKRVRTGAFGVENQGGSGNPVKTQLKLLYYNIFTTLYSTCLLFSQFTMTNSSWTQAHIESLLVIGRKAWINQVFLPTEVLQQTRPEVVYPPCDVDGLTKLGKLDRRKRQLVSLAQFRPEKEHYKQIRAMATLLKQHPEYREGEKRVTLTLMGGARHTADRARVEGLRKLASDLGIQDHVEFLVNAPYPEIERRLGEASIGLNTMQDEHFGINIVEFMAAGLIPIVHASAGPKMDIVTPYHGQQTGYHALAPQDFADRIHDAFSLSRAEERKMREAARGQAREKFSLQGFERGFEAAWEGLVRSVEAGREEPQVEGGRVENGRRGRQGVGADRGLKQRRGRGR